MSTTVKAILALIITVFLWSVLSIVARGSINAVPTFTLIFLRFSFASIPFLPIFLMHKPWKKKRFLHLVGLSFLSTINITSYLWGLKSTSATTSQLIYAGIPLTSIVVSALLFNEKTSLRKTFGVVIGFVGLLFILYQSVVEHGTTITGSWQGNILVLVAMVAWTFYILYSKRLSIYFSPLEIASTSVLVSFVPTLIFALIELFVYKAPIQNLSVGIFAAAYMGIFGTFFTYILYQYAIKHTSALVVSLSMYIQPIITAILATFILNEKLTLNFMIGVLIVFAGVFITTTLELYHRRNTKKL